MPSRYTFFLISNIVANTHIRMLQVNTFVCSLCSSHIDQRRLPALIYIVPIANCDITFLEHSIAVICVNPQILSDPCPLSLCRSLLTSAVVWFLLHLSPSSLLPPSATSSPLNQRAVLCCTAAERRRNEWPSLLAPMESRGCLECQRKDPYLR